MALLEADRLSVRFDGVVALDGISFSVEKGEIHGVIGPNGAGKTSLVNAITGVVSAHGNIRFEGRDISGLSPHAISARGLGRTFQHGELFGDETVIENVLAGFYRRQPYGIAAAMIGFGKANRMERETRARAVKVLDEFGLVPMSGTRARDLPFGLQKRVDMARAIAAMPRLLLLDEPVSGMSEGEADETVEAIRRMAREHGITLVVIEHNMRVIMGLADRITVLNQGQVLAQGSPKEVRANAEVIQAYLGDEA